ncbi:MAG: IS66 family transposase [Rhodanobacter sp.]
MNEAALNAITDTDALRALVREQMAKVAHRDVIIARRDHEIAYKTAKIDKLTHELARLRRVQFSARSERMNPEQRELFDEAMAADIAAVEAELGALQDAFPSSPTKPPRTRPVRRPLPPELPREITVHTPSQCDCATCGTALMLIGTHASEKLDVKPPVFFVRRDEYPQLACPRCETIVAEPVAPALIDRGQAAPGLLAQVAIQKYADHLPLYRQEAIFARHGITLARSTLAEWLGHVGLRLQPLVDALRARLLTAEVLHADETPVAQLDPGAGKTKRAYLFAYRSTGDHPIVVFDYCPTRAGKHAADFLGPWQGALMVDDYGGYKALFAHGITELGCWAHARRKFFDAHKASGSPTAKAALQHMAALYAIEATLRELPVETRGRERQRLLVPQLDALKRWLDELQPKVLGNTGLDKAVNYTLKRWNALARVADDGRYPIDNNPIENAIRPIAIGRKNWLFAGSETAGKRAAAIMSLLATAKANGVEPHAWLTDVLTRLPTTKDRDIASLLPTRGYGPLR